MSDNLVDQAPSGVRHPVIVLGLAGVVLSTIMGALAAIGRIHLGSIAAPIVAVRQPGLVDMAVAVGLVAILAGSILASARTDIRARRAPVVVGLALADMSALPLSTGRC